MHRHAIFSVSPASMAGLWVAVAMATGFIAGCDKGSPVGRLCDIGSETTTGAATIASGSLDCVTRTCLQVPAPGQPGGSGTKGMCTDFCSDDSDCAKVSESPCNSEFVCTIATTVGAYCCEKLCICKDYIVVPDEGEIPTPAACDSNNADNACCNLEGREGNPAYPLC